MITTPTDIKQLGTIVAVWAHPDDETYLAAGILAAAVRNGQAVVCVTATRGEAGSYDHRKWPADQIADIRTKELGNALGILGIPKHYWLDYKDGECHKAAKKEAVEDLKAIVQRYQPDTILTFGSDGWTGHTDHCAVSSWVEATAESLENNISVYHAVVEKDQYNNYLKPADERLNIFFNIDKPPVIVASKCDIHFKLTPELNKLKKEALLAAPSQTENLFRTFDEAFIAKALGHESFVKAPTKSK